MHQFADGHGLGILQANPDPPRAGAACHGCQGPKEAPAAAAAATDSEVQLTGSVLSTSLSHGTESSQSYFVQVSPTMTRTRRRAVL